MGLRNTSTGWGWLARLFHWGMAVLIIGMLGFGFWLTLAYNPGDLAKFNQVQLHKSFGFCVFVLACLRLIWRGLNPTPPLPEHMPSHLRLGAHLGHWTLYVLMFAIPITGWLGVSSSPYNDPGYMQIPNEVFGLFAMPDPYPEGSHDLSGLYMTIHFYLALGLLLVLAAHIAAAIKHAVVDRDGVMKRMTSGS